MKQVNLRVLAVMKNGILHEHETLEKLVKPGNAQQLQDFLKAVTQYCWLVNGVWILKSKYCKSYDVQDSEQMQNDDYKNEEETTSKIKRRALIRDYLVTLFERHKWVDRKRHFIHNTTLSSPPDRITQLLHSLGRSVPYDPEL